MIATKFADKVRLLDLLFALGRSSSCGLISKPGVKIFISQPVCAACSSAERTSTAQATGVNSPVARIPNSFKAEWSNAAVSAGTASNF